MSCKWEEYGENKKNIIAQSGCGRHMNINYETLEQAKKEWLCFCPFCGKEIK